jgi:hypothetical protein
MLGSTLVNMQPCPNMPWLQGEGSCRRYQGTVDQLSQGCIWYHQPQILGHFPVSLWLDANVVFGFFNYYLGHGYAVDEDLYRMIVDEASTCSTAAIASRLRRLQRTEYLDQYQLYLGAVGLDKVRRPQRKKQRTITSMLPKPSGDPELDSLTKARHAMQMEAKRQRALMNSAHNKHSMDISFRAILKDKENHKHSRRAEPNSRDRTNQDREAYLL